eukprot:s1385_g34.t1
MPPFCATGRREHWLDLDPRALREWAMAPMAAMLGLTDSLAETRPGSLEDALQSKDELKSGHLYADILVGPYFDAAAPDAVPEKRGTTGHWGRTVQLLHGIHSLPRAMSNISENLAPAGRWRQQAVGAMRELKRRWQGVTLHLHHFQEPALHQVVKQHDIGLLALLMILTSWADTGLPYGLVRGLPAVGYAPPYGIFVQQGAALLTMDDVLSGWEAHNQQILNSLKPGKDDVFLLQQSMEDADNGFCTPPMRQSDFLRLIKGQPHRLIPRCVITQSSGKQRVIDNGDTGGQSDRSADANKLTLCSALRPAQHITLAMQAWDQEDVQTFQAGDAWESGQEDLPSAYRFCPMSRAESLGCVVVWHHAEWQEPAFQLYSGLLFGLVLAVTSFNRCSRLLEALARRFCRVLLSMYFDDASITDLKSACGSGQWAANELFAMVGSPFAAEKKQPMQSTGTFLGLTHDFGPVASHNFVTFWARDRLHDKVRGIIKHARDTQTLTRGTAAKLYGVANFLEQGIYGRVGYGGLMAIKARQDETLTTLTPAICACFEVIEAVMRFCPKREFSILPVYGDRFLAASDAAVEEDTGGSGGFHLIFFQPDQSQIRLSFVATNCTELQNQWQPAVTHIAQLELAMVLYALGYWEYVQRKSNWADDISSQSPKRKSAKKSEAAKKNSLKVRDRERRAKRSDHSSSASRRKRLDNATVLFRKAMRCDPTQSYYAVHANEKRTTVTITQKSRFGIGDVYFLAVSMGICEVIEDEIKRVSASSIHLESGRRVEALDSHDMLVDVILKLYGFNGNFDVDRLMNVKSMTGFWVDEDKFPTAVTVGLQSPGLAKIRVNATNFGGTSFSPGVRVWVDYVAHFLWYPKDWAYLRDCGLLPKHSAEEEIDRPAYVIDARHGTQTSMAIGSTTPAIGESQMNLNLVKRQKQLECHPTNKFLQECSEEWKAYGQKFKELGAPRECPPYPYTLKIVEAGSYLQPTKKKLR